MRSLLVLFTILAMPLLAQTTPKPRARDLGIPFDGTPGRYNAITDVAGVEVGHVTIISGSGKLEAGKGPVRTGVTSVFPRGRERSNRRVFAAWFTLNGNGEMTGTTWLKESGLLGRRRFCITNTHSVGIVRDAVIAWNVKHTRRRKATRAISVLPLVAETWDGFLNDINGFHVKTEHVFGCSRRPRAARSPRGMSAAARGWSCISSRAASARRRACSGEPGGYTVGVLVQANYGARELLASPACRSARRSRT